MKAEKIYKLHFEITRKGGKIESYTLENEKLVIGRSSQADLIILEGDISRKHLLIERENDKVFLTDLGSANGSFISDEKMQANERIEFNTFFLPIKLGQKVSFILTLEIAT